MMERENIKSTTNDSQVLIGAAKLMEDVFNSGLYRELKTTENKLAQIKARFKGMFEHSEQKRHYLPYGLVAKFVPTPVYSTDEESLKDFLNDFGLITKTVVLKERFFKDDPEILKMLKPFQKPFEYFSQFYLNSEGNKHIDHQDYYFEELELEPLSLLFLKQKQEFEVAQFKYKDIMKEINVCPILRQSQVVKTTYGSCKLRKKEVEYYSDSINLEYGSEILLKYGKISMASLDTFISKGYFSTTEIQQFRKIDDIKLRFVVMDIETERKQAEALQKQIMWKAQNRRYA